MPVPFATEQHKDYALMFPIWRRCRDGKAGEDAVKARGEDYLPRLDGQTDTQYTAYKDRARYYNAFNKTITGHVGLATRKPILIEQPDALEPITDNIDREGSDITGYVRAVLTEILTSGRGVSLVDFTKLDDQATMLDAEGARPYWIFYRAEDFIDWQYEDGQLIYAVLREVQEQRGRDVRQEFRYRVLELLPPEDNPDGPLQYTQKVYEGETLSSPVEVIVPLMNGNPMDFIPAFVHQSDYDIHVDMPPLIDLVNLCLSYYRLKADHAHALHYVALPTPYIIGVDPDDENAPSTIGPQKIWIINNPDAEVGMLEFTGAGVEAIEKELKVMEEQMAIIGARILLPEISENTATASTLRSIAETSDLASIVIILERQFNNMLDFTAAWANIAGDTEINWDKQFLPHPMDGAMLTAMVAAWQSGGFDYETLVTNFKKAEIVDPEKTIEELQEATEAEGDERMRKAAEAMAALEAQGNDDEEDEENDEEDEEEEEQ